MASITQIAPGPENCPFAFEHQLNHELGSNSDGQTKQGAVRTQHEQHLPGHPSIKLSERCKLYNFLEKEFYSLDMDRAAPRLWWMAKQDKASISALHRQKVKGRNIVISEDPKLHLVWIYDRVFIKPLPKYILSHAFWRDYLGANSMNGEKEEARQVRRTRAAALGYLRTFRYLVKHESDFDLAKSLVLIPEGVTWEAFCAFSADLTSISNSEVSGRWAYGEIRLTRLNLYAPLIFGKQSFQRVEYQYGAVFAKFYGPILFILGILSVSLSGMQIAVAAEQIDPVGNALLLIRVSSWFGIVTVICSAVLVFALAVLWVYKVVKEWNYAIRDRLRLLNSGEAVVKNIS